MILLHDLYYHFFFTSAATTEIYTLSLHDALPICIFHGKVEAIFFGVNADRDFATVGGVFDGVADQERHQIRSEEHTSELQSQSNLVCRLLLEKKKYKRRVQ